MSWPLLREAQRDGTLGRRQLGRKMVLIFLARRADDDGLVKIGSRVVADETGIDHRHVRRLLDELASMGRIDLVRPGSNGRGHAHTWRVLSMAEWRERRDGKEGVTPSNARQRKEGVGAPEKGATSPPLELPPELPPPPPHGSSRRRAATPPAPPLPGLGPGEEGLSALGRAAGKGPRSARRRARLEREAQARRAAEEASAQRLAELEAYERRAMTPEALAARRELRERFLSPRRAVGG
ncbi:hypothetical protein [Miltoncostaea marina]|uniref:hypothetical protein n=1 Tax=Miltoncostaea marina TaxID=2843215 RepID=UPI001C3C9F8F|nr:hypothetical protein [Miltoncostaea marina]